MACLYCGKEIGAFRLLRDKEFCSSAHRREHHARARLGKVMGQISAVQPPPAPPAGFVPYQPPAGENRSPSTQWTFVRYQGAPSMLPGCPVPIARMLSESLMPLEWPEARMAKPAESCRTARAPRWKYHPSSHFPQLQLQPANGLPEAVEAPVGEPPLAALLPLGAAAALPSPLGRYTAGPLFSPLDLCADGLPVWPRAIRGAMPGLRAEPVEAFLSPSREPEALVFPIEAAAPPCRLAVIAPEIEARLAEAAPSLAAQPVESFLPTAAEPQAVAFAAALYPPSFPLTAAEWYAASRLAEPAPSLAAQAVESLLPAPADPQFTAYPAAVLTPGFSLQAAEWVIGAELAPLAAPLEAQAVESFLPAPNTPNFAAFPAVVALPAFGLTAAEWVIDAELAPIAPPLEAQPVESFLPAPQPCAAAFARSVILPQAPAAAAEWLTDTEEVTGNTIEAGQEFPAALPQAAFAAAPGADFVESFLPASPQPAAAAWPATISTPGFALTAAEWLVTGSLAEPAESPAAQAVESFLPLPAPTQSLPYPQALFLPALALAAEWTVAAELADPSEIPAPQAVESFLRWGVEPAALSLPIPALRLPRFSLSAEAEAVEEMAPEMLVAPPSEAWMPSPQAAEVEREVIPALTGPLPLIAAIQAPGAATLTMQEPMIRWTGGWRMPASAEPVSAYVSPYAQGAVASPSPLCLPNLRSLQSQQRIPHGLQTQLAAPAETQKVRFAASQGAAPSSEGAVAPRPAAVELPGLALNQTMGTQAAPIESTLELAAKPTQAASTPAHPPAAPRPAIQTPAAPAPVSLGLLPGGPAGSDFICQRGVMAPVYQPIWHSRSAAVQPPKFTLRSVYDRAEQPAAPPKPAPEPEPISKTPAFGEIFTLRDIARRRVYTSSLNSTGKAIAASLLVGIGLWFGAGSARILRQIESINTQFSSISVPGNPDTGSAAPVRAVAQQASGPIAALRRVIQQRAAVELTDTFRRMESWGAAAKTMPTGWSRHADGYMHTGQLALYKPSQSFSDYRLEFFGQIEKKSMGWAVRAHDTQNYMGMKFTVIEPGLRPMIAMVHYPVIDGKRGRRVETPLNVMVHNDEPFRVSVDVKGSQIITSIDGQEVDSFTNDSLKSGAVGFFSEVGESARLYWVRVTSNQDWLGRVCAYLSGGSGSATAELWPGEIPGGPSQPSQTPMPGGIDVTLAAVELEEFSQPGPQRGRIFRDGRTELCRS